MKTTNATNKKLISKALGRCVVLVALIALCVSACGVQYAPVCRHKAVLSALVGQEHFQDVVIFTGPTPSGERHAQARAFTGAEWVWLDYDGYKVKAGRQHDFTPQRSYSVQEAVNSWFIPASATNQNTRIASLQNNS